MVLGLALWRWFDQAIHLFPHGFCVLVGWLILSSCSSEEEVIPNPTSLDIGDVPFLPPSDPKNIEEWHFRHDLSDEFNGEMIDEDKWYIAGRIENLDELDEDEGSAADWVGRAPSLFDPSNVQLENGILKLTIEWEPDSPLFPFWMKREM